VRRSVVLAGAFSAITLAATVFGGAVADASTAHYVALGDSYSSGVGSGSYDLSSSCDRSSAAYPALYKAATAPSVFTFVACTGATASDIESSQLSSLNSSTTLVSVTDGGNDAGFTTIMEDCILESDSGCTSAINSAESYVQNTLPGVLHTLYSDIRADSPGAHVVVVGYPEFYDLSQSSGCIGLDTTKRTALDGAADDLDSTLSGVVGGFSDFSYADVRSHFAGHQLCDSSPWLHSLNFGDLTESYHPTAAGQQAYLAAFESGV
jgi:lysophospholipase L1-like esterase